MRLKLELGGAQCCLPVTVDTQVSDDLIWRSVSLRTVGKCLASISVWR